MTPELNTELTATMEWLRTSAQDGQAFVLEQAPLYAQELIAYNITAAWFGLASGALALAITGTALRVLMWAGKSKDISGEAEENWIISSIILAVIAVMVSAIVIPTNTHSLVKNYTAPRVVIVEHIREVLR